MKKEFVDWFFGVDFFYLPSETKFEIMIALLIIIVFMLILMNGVMSLYLFIQQIEFKKEIEKLKKKG